MVVTLAGIVTLVIKANEDCGPIPVTGIPLMIGGIVTAPEVPETTPVIVTAVPLSV